MDSLLSMVRFFVFFFLNLIILLHRVLIVGNGLSSSGAHGVFDPQPGMEPVSPALQGGFLTIGPLEKFLTSDLS